MKTNVIMYWVRRDFRLHDNPALAKALAESNEQKISFLPLFILEDYMCSGDPLSQFGYPSRMFLSKALPQFSDVFNQFALVRGTVVATFKKLSQKFKIILYVNEDVYPDFYTQVKKIKALGIDVHVLKDQMTVSRDVVTGTKNVYSIFTPFKKSIWKDFMSASEVPVAKPKSALMLSEEEFLKITHQISLSESALRAEFSVKRSVIVGKHAIDLDSLTPAPQLDTRWYFSESAAHARFDAFLSVGGVHEYKKMRDSLEYDAEETQSRGIPFEGKTSRMSLALAWGLISARTLKCKIQKHFKDEFLDLDSLTADVGALTFLSELVWREFYKYLYYHNPKLQSVEFQEKFRGTIRWINDTDAYLRFIAWVKGETGYPVVDAAMKQLAETGWMHNRARMIVASVLTKNFGVDWRWGQEYFRAALIDLDEASNNGGWQWGASVGADPKPIRIFNAELQAKSHDASCAYQRRWLGEDRVLHPLEPIIDHPTARTEALKRYGLNIGAPRRDF